MVIITAVQTIVAITMICVIARILNFIEKGGEHICQKIDAEDADVVSDLEMTVYG